MTRVGRRRCFAVAVAVVVSGAAAEGSLAGR